MKDDGRQTHLKHTDQALAAMVDCLRPDRALVLKVASDLDLEVEGAHGLPAQGALQSGFVSLTVFAKVVTSAESLWTTDARQHPDLKDSFSLQMSEIRSIVSTPLFHPETGVWGLLYCDRKVDSSSFKLDDLKWLLLCARRLEDSLFEGKPFDVAQLRQSVEAMRPTSRPRPARTAAALEVVPAAHRNLKPRAQSITLLLRHMSIMLGCGVPLAEILAVLLADQDDLAMRGILESMSARLLAGRPLSKTMQSFPRAFSGFQVSVVRAGETSGRLPQVLEMLAVMAERQHALSLKLRSALAYPLSVLVICLGGAVLVPPFLFRGHLEALRASGQALPLLTRGLIAFSDVLQQPWVWLLLAGAVVAGLAAARRLPERPEWQASLRALARRAPVVGSVLQQVSKARFAQTLAMGLRSGLSAVPALEQAAEVSGDPELRAQELREHVMAGTSITEALRRSGRFDSIFLAMVESGEEAGRLEELLRWQARLAEVDIEHWLDQFTSLLEPLVLAIVGTVVGIVLVATMLPTLQLLEGM